MGEKLPANAAMPKARRDAAPAWSGPSHAWRNPGLGRPCWRALGGPLPDFAPPCQDPALHLPPPVISPKWAVGSASCSAAATA
jgi:hypothetical protein